VNGDTTIRNLKESLGLEDDQMVLLCDDGCIKRVVMNWEKMEDIKSLREEGGRLVIVNFLVSTPNQLAPET
jgi:hypothetical protein